MTVMVMKSVVGSGHRSHSRLHCGLCSRRRRLQLRSHHRATSAYVRDTSAGTAPTGNTRRVSDSEHGGGPVRPRPLRRRRLNQSDGGEVRVRGDGPPGTDRSGDGGGGGVEGRHSHSNESGRVLVGRRRRRLTLTDRRRDGRGDERRGRNGRRRRKAVVTVIERRRTIVVGTTEQLMRLMVMMLVVVVRRRRRRMRGRLVMVVVVVLGGKRLDARVKSQQFLDCERRGALEAAGAEPYGGGSGGGGDYR